MNYWITTDTHFGHDNLIEYDSRPKNFSDIIIKNLYDMIKKDDILIHLGDICFGNDEIWHKVISSLGCKYKWLIRGNHDRKSSNWYFNHGWHFVGNAIILKRYGLNILLTHIPKRDLSYFDINIHGHFHNTNFRKHELEIASTLNVKHVLLAQEYNNYKPWKLETIIKKFKRDNHV
jgi:calcineurin-like phosphoesterase family protein